MRRKTHESRLLVKTGFELADRLGIGKLIIQADALLDVRMVEKLRGSEAIIWITRRLEEIPGEDKSKDAFIRIPDADLSRMSQIKLGLFLAVLDQSIDLEESVLCLTGVSGSRRLDMLLVANPHRDFPWFRKHDLEDVRTIIGTREFARVVDVSLRLATEGREGRPIGTILVLGDQEQLSPHLRQLVLNPCEGHARKKRSIHEEGFFETLREFAALDGAFVVNSGTGVVESAATYLDAGVKKADLRSGWGARHTAGLAITAVTDAISVVVSSSGTVTVFHEGKAILELERPQSGSRTRGKIS